MGFLNWRPGQWLLPLSCGFVAAKEGSQQVHLAAKIEKLLPSEWKKLNA